MSTIVEQTQSDMVPEEHPAAPYLRMDRIPHIWCPTCGIGTAVKCFATALEESGVDSELARKFLTNWVLTPTHKSAITWSWYRVVASQINRGHEAIVAPPITARLTSRERLSISSETTIVRASTENQESHLATS